MKRSPLRAMSFSPTATELLGRELRRLRLHRELSLRKLTRLVGMTAHSGLVDYERGIRIPPHDLFNALLSVLHPGNGQLVSLYRAALAERTQQRVSTTSGTRSETSGGTWCERCAPAMDELADALEKLATGLRRRQIGKPHHQDNPERRTAS